jgi:hypothetical protein
MHSKFTQKIWSAPKVHYKSFAVHLKSTQKILECTKKSTHLECTQSPLQKNWSTQHSTSPKMLKFWSAQLLTPFFLEWTAVHFILFFGVDTCPLQNVGVHVVKVWSAFSLTQNIVVAVLQGLMTGLQLSPLDLLQRGVPSGLPGRPRLLVFHIVI